MTKVKSISYDHRARLFWTLATIITLLVTVYIYSIYTTARNVAERENLEKQIAGVSADLNPLEFAYIKLKNDITLELALVRGFKEVKNPLYVSRSRAVSLSFNTLE